METDDSADYLPNFGRPDWLGPISLDDWRFPELNQPVDVVLIVRRTDVKGNTSREQHWFIQWDRGCFTDNGREVPVTRRVQIVREMILRGSDDERGRMLPHLANWGANTKTPTGLTTVERSHRIIIKRMTKEERVRLQEIADSTRVRVPNGRWNCQDWIKTVLMTAVQEALIDQGQYDEAITQAESVPPAVVE